MTKVTQESQDFQAANEIGKIYNSLLDKKLLCDFFLESASNFIQAAESYLYLTGSDEKLWLESGGINASAPGAAEKMQKEADAALKTGKPILKENKIFVPLVVRNNAVGMACFIKATGVFTEGENMLVQSLAAQAASALKNILLLEENIRMERLAAIGRTMSMVMHEIKNIIQIAKFGQEYLRMGVNEDKKQYLARGMEMFDKTVREMDGFTYELLSLTKNYEIQPLSMNMKILLEELAKDLKDKAEQAVVKLDFEVVEPFPEVKGEERSLLRALLNLVKNAIEACDKENSFIRIRVRDKGDAFYEIRVEDNGKGMTDEVKAKLFQAFFSTKGDKGTGLGLLIIERTIKAHKGELKVESEPGKGTAFILTLPKTPLIIPSVKKVG